MPYLRFLFPLLTFILYVSASFYVLSNGHVHEDAYILFIFSESLANGQGISYFPGSGPIEGATDFLWMAILAAAVFIGIDVAIAAAILNGIGLAVISYYVLKLSSLSTSDRSYIPFGVLTSAIIFLSPISMAALAGFSTGFYCAFVCVIFHIIYAENTKSLIMVPVIGIIMGLLRPDGVIIGVFASLVGLSIAYRRGLLQKYLIVSAVCAVVGASYFFWRFNYFGHLLPLPLYVKSASASSLPGLAPHYDWLQYNGFLAGLVILSAYFMPHKRKIFMAAVPVMALFIALAFATQSQNISFRFQAPATTLLLLISALVYAAYLKGEFSGRVRSFIIFFMAIAALGSTIDYSNSTKKMFVYLTSNEYINYLSFHMRKLATPDTTIALTEAGRFAYWMQGRKFDLVGLNTPETAIHKVSPEYIQKIDPDLVFIHIASTVSLEKICGTRDFCTVTIDQLRQSMLVEKNWEAVSNGVDRAPLATYSFLESSGQYQLYAVRYGRSRKYNHMHAVKKDGRISISDFEASLVKSFKEEGRLSYLEMKKLTKSVFAD